jgi:hypothetical protein
VAPPILITHKSLRQKRTQEVEQKNKTKLSCVRYSTIEEDICLPASSSIIIDKRKCVATKPLQYMKYTHKHTQLYIMYTKQLHVTTKLYIRKFLFFEQNKIIAV